MSSDAALGGDAAIARGFLQRRVVALVLVRVGFREGRHRAVERLAGSEICRDRDAIAGAGMSAREGPAAERAVDAQAGGGHQLHLGPELPVPQLAYVVVARRVIGPAGAQPAEEDIAVDLHPPLALDHALPVMTRRFAAGVMLQHRWAGLLDLQEQRVVAVASDQEDDPGPGADAADPADPPRHVRVAVALEEVPPFDREG